MSECLFFLCQVILLTYLTVLYAYNYALERIRERTSDSVFCMAQDANRLVRQSDEYSQCTDIILSVFRALQSYRLRNLVESYQAFDKAAKYVTTLRCIFFVLNGISSNLEIAVILFRNFVIGNRDGRWKHSM